MKIKHLYESNKLELDNLQQTLADSDINSSVKDGKVVVDKDDLALARKIAKKLGFKATDVVSEK